MKLKVLHSAEAGKGHEYIRTKIFKFDNPNNPKIFKLHYSNRNGTSDMNCSIMDSDGIFQQVLNKYSLGFEHKVSYVAYDSEKQRESDEAFRLAEKVLINIYG